MTREELQTQIFEHMNTSKRLMTPYFSEVLAKLKLSPAQAHLLSTINENQPLSLKTLAAKMFMTPGAITQLIEALERQNLITRTRDDKDRRITYINISPNGSDVITAIHRYRNELMANLLGTLTDAELESLAAIQQKMTIQLEKHTKEHAAKKEKA